MYSLHDYGSMIADTVRFNAYAEAIARAVRPNDVVLEIGCGPGIFAFIACRAGARKVYAIEREEIIHFAREIASANGFSDRIEFIHADSCMAELPEQAAVIISDVRGCLPLFDHAIRTVGDARQRFLAPGGRLIPQRDILKAAVVETPEFYSELIAPWRYSVPGMDLCKALSSVLQNSYSLKLKREQILSEPQSWCILDYQGGICERASAELDFRSTRAGTAYGVCIWFDTELFEGIGFSSGPNNGATIYGQVFLPWMEPVNLAESQEIHIVLQADLVGSDYVWRWETQTRAADSGRPIDFRQSTFQGAIFSGESLQRRTTDYVPTLSATGKADLYLLQAMNGKTSLQQMAEAAAARFPKIFPRWQDAFERAIELAAKSAQ